MWTSVSKTEGYHPQDSSAYPDRISKNNIKNVFSDCEDFEVRDIDLGLGGHVTAAAVWLDGVVNGTAVSETILRPLTEHARLSECRTESEAIELLLSGAVYSNTVKRTTDFSKLVSLLTHGQCALIFDRAAAAVSFEVRTSNVRSVSEPTLEKSTKGSKESFVETLRTNTALVRRRLCTPKLKLKQTALGRKSDTQAAIFYVEGLTDPSLVTRIETRLASVDIDGVLSSGALEEYIVDSPRSPFPQIMHTERPDRLARYLLDGRVAVIVDGLPLAFVMPVSFAAFMRVSGDDSLHFTVATFLTVIRYFALLISLLLPAVYVAVAMYHQEMIPTQLLFSVIEAKQDVPFTTGMEVFGMLIAFELLQEAGLRLPDPVGDTVSIIGALIVGESAVEASFVSPIAIIVVALSGIAGYSLPSQDLGGAVRLMRLALLLAGVLAGLYGIAVGMCLILLHLAGLESFGTNYTAPLSDGRPWGLWRLLVRPPKPQEKYRDRQLNTDDKRKQR